MARAHLTPLRIDGRYHCMDCRELLPPPRGFQGRKCRPRLRCDQCGDLHHLRMRFLSGRDSSAYVVARARRLGDLPSPREFACADCGRPARCYDHRDYGEPLRVDPVCHQCNVRRGPAKPLNQILVAALLIARLSDGGA